MRRVLREKNGDRVFESTNRWNEVQYTVISDKNSNAKYADNYGNGDKKLFLSYIRFLAKTVPINMFHNLEVPIKLETGVKLTKVDENNLYYLEENSKGERVRVYWEAKE